MSKKKKPKENPVKVLIRKKYRRRPEEQDQTTKQLQDLAASLSESAAAIDELVKKSKQKK